MDATVEFLDRKQIEDIIYFVKENESLESIARKFCVSIKTLREDNDLSNGYEVLAGDILWIRKRNKAMYVVKPADTLESIADKFNVTVEHLKRVNNIKSVFIGQKIII